MVGEFIFDNGTWKKDGCLVRSAPIQPRETVPWEIALEAYKECVNQFGRVSTLASICERGGFGADELAILLFQRVKHLERRIYQLRGQQRG